MTQRRWHALLLATTAVVPLGMAWAGSPAPPTLPQGPTVVNGSATFSTQGSTYIVNQTTNSAIINWNTFNIPTGDKVRIIMPSGGSELDRVTGGGGASQIFGTLTSN